MSIHASFVSSFLKWANHKATAEICGKQINRGAGFGLEIPVIYKIYSRRKEIFGQTGQTYLWQSETAMRALGEKDEGF